ncbi:Metallo peptidase M28 [Heterobasidion irregulare TC 32-1]|uniref:Peptide hydrolase n=1 Tax=Heterobasidion irregulare (strain TC 32-1) TaxID=747525 RepID=W4KMT2_HETIT|nr:Metallo peptidase M28 [Heterobasidion irregulare TC 32-1]ETW86341.1 Metallo peptidase M28 [Heterobasidion irregulare TC 32-1]
MSAISRWTLWSLSGCILIVLALVQCTEQAASLGERQLRPLSLSALAALVGSPDPIKNIDPSNPRSHLSHILIPRPPDTANNTLVRTYIISTLRALNWHIEEDSFVDTTPYGPKNFTNVIATKDPSAPRRVALAAHFDSKFFEKSPENQFLGATDSAAPCALMLDLAEALNPLLDARAKRLADAEGTFNPDADEDEDEALHTTLQLIFFDGEEAFKDWTDTDSIYGARHLADKWSSTFLPPHPKRRLLPYSSPPTALSTLEHLVLLDLLGASAPRIRSFFPDTGWLFDMLVRAEDRLRAEGLLDPAGAGAAEAWRSFFVPRTGKEASMGYVGDDHVPFLRRGVSVLHVIAEPFPRVWHTLADDASALDLPTLRRWNLLLRVFFCEYLGLQPDVGAGAKRDAHARLREAPHPHRGEEPPTSSTPPESERVTGAQPNVRRSDSEL